MILGTIGIITAMSAGYITILKMCDGDNHVSREENQRRYQTSEKNKKKCYNTTKRTIKSKNKHNCIIWMTKKKTDNIIDNHVFDK